MRLAFIFCAGLALAACQTRPLPPPVIFAPVSCPPSMTQPVQAMPAEALGADMDVVNTPEANAAAFLFWDGYQALVKWGREGWARAATGKAFCEGRQ